MFTVEEFASYVDIPVDEVNVKLLESLIREARVLIRYEDPSLSDDAVEWPEEALIVGMRVVARGYDRRMSGIPGTAESSSVTAGPFSQNYSFGSGSSGNSLWLTKDDKKLLTGATGGSAFAVDLLPGPEVPRFYRYPEWWVPL